MLGIHTTTLKLSVAAIIWDVLLTFGRNEMLRTCIVLLDWAASPAAIASLSDEERSHGLCAAIKGRILSSTEDDMLGILSAARSMATTATDEMLEGLREANQRRLEDEAEARQLRASIFR